MVKLIALLKRKPELTLEAFAQRWLEEHTKLSRELSGLLEYRINIATPQQEGEAEPLYDGTAEMWWESVEAMEEAFQTELGQRAGADADTFCAQRVHIYTDENVILPNMQNASQ